MFGAGERVRTVDLNLGKVALYQLSYARISDPDFGEGGNCIPFPTTVKDICGIRRISSPFRRF